MDYSAKKSVMDIDVSGKKVLVRVDFNVPISNGFIEDDNRIVMALPTILLLLDRGAAVILASHLGRPDGERNLKYTLRPVVESLSRLLMQPVLFAEDCVGEAAEQAARDLKPGQVLLLENLRFHAEEEANDSAFAAQLASLADIYVDDAFGTAHRKHASTVGVPAYLPAVAGLLIDDEVQKIERATGHPERPFIAIIGGAKISDKILVIDNMLNKVDKLLVGGGMANTFLAAMGHDMQASLVEKDRLDWAREYLQTDIAREKLMLPVDVIAAAAFAPDAEHKPVAVSAIPAGWMALDIGAGTIKQYGGLIADAKTVVWNGPLGAFEMDAFAAGTMGMVRAVAESSAFSVIGGGDSAAAAKKAGMTDRFSHVSTGGGATLKYLEGKPLAAIEALNDKE